MEDYQKKINTVFEKWIEDYKSDGRKSFVKDGIPFPEEYYSNSPKVLFTLKDPNDLKADYESSQLDSYRKYAETGEDDWNNRMKLRISKIYKILSNKPDLEDNKAIRNIAFMNLKKTGGSNWVPDNVVALYASKYRDRIIEQIEVINPDYIVCCGCAIPFVKYVILDLPLNKRIRWKKFVERKGNYGYFWREKNIVVIDMYHPSYTRNGFSGAKGDAKYIDMFKERIAGVLSLDKK